MSEPSDNGGFNGSPPTSSPQKRSRHKEKKKRSEPPKRNAAQAGSGMSAAKVVREALEVGVVDETAPHSSTWHTSTRVDASSVCSETSRLLPRRSAETSASIGRDSQQVGSHRSERMLLRFSNGENPSDDDLDEVDHVDDDLDEEVDEEDATAFDVEFDEDDGMGVFPITSGMMAQLDRLRHHHHPAEVEVDSSTTGSSSEYQSDDEEDEDEEVILATGGDGLIGSVGIDGNLYEEGHQSSDDDDVDADMFVPMLDPRGANYSACNNYQDLQLIKKHDVARARHPAVDAKWSPWRYALTRRQRGIALVNPIAHKLEQLKAWNHVTRHPVQASVYCLTHADDKPLLFSGHETSQIQVLDPIDGTLIQLLNTPHPCGVNAISVCGNAMSTASDDASIAIWDLRKLSSPTKILRGHEGWVKNAVFGPDEVLVSAAFDDSIRLWNWKDATTAPSFTMTMTGIRRIRLSDDASTLAIGCEPAVDTDIMGGIALIRDIDFSAWEQTFAMEMDYSIAVSSACADVEDYEFLRTSIPRQVVGRRNRIEAIGPEHLMHAALSLDITPDGSTLATREQLDPMFGGDFVAMYDLRMTAEHQASLDDLRNLAYEEYGDQLPSTLQLSKLARHGSLPIIAPTRCIWRQKQPISNEPVIKEVRFSCPGEEVMFFPRHNKIQALRRSQVSGRSFQAVAWSSPPLLGDEILCIQHNSRTNTLAVGGLLGKVYIMSPYRS
eukprot:m.210720 g.210720  ORF g.210720 m.210720 type:complete len:723 (-) comp15052_c0_seq21:2450-4618(-)